MSHKPRVLVDFDGVIHRYSKGWHDGTAYDEPMPGAKAALTDMELSGYEIVIFSTRDAGQIRAWLHKHGFLPYSVTNEKLPAVAMIDDRAIRHVEWDETLHELAERYPIK